MKYGNLRLKEDMQISKGSHKKVWWICDCGKEKLMQVYSVVSGHAVSCGRCNEISAEEMSVRKFGKLRIKNPINVMHGSHEKLLWKCDCGKETTASVYSITSGSIKSCGRCNEISAEEIANKKFGNLRIKNPIDTLSGSNKKVWWICDCGREKLIDIKLVLSGNTSSCGRCNEVSLNNISFGRLEAVDDYVMLYGSKKKIQWLCKCGRKTFVRASYVISGRVISCGHCHETVYNWYLNNKEKLKLLKCPIKPEDFPYGGPKPLEIIKYTSKPFKCICASCKEIYYPRFGDIKSGRSSLTCGCASYHVSKGQKDMAEYIKSLGFEVHLEYKVNKLKYDIFVPSKNLLIEYQGEKWHSSHESVERDQRKKQNASDNGYNFLAIYEKEWKKNTKEVKENINKHLNLI